MLVFLFISVDFGGSGISFFRGNGVCSCSLCCMWLPGVVGFEGGFLAHRWHRAAGLHDRAFGV